MRPNKSENWSERRRKGNSMVAVRNTTRFAAFVEMVWRAHSTTASHQS